MIHFLNGKRYEGEWKNDRKEGEGVVYTLTKGERKVFRNNQEI